MNPQGVERVQRFPLPKAQHPCRFACDGLGRILLAHDEETYCFENGSLSPLGFHILSGDGFNGSIPVPGTGRLVMCGFSDRELVARLLELDVDTAPLPDYPDAERRSLVEPSSRLETTGC